MNERYDGIAMLLHWSIAVLIAVTFLLGLTVDDFPKAYEDAVVNTHVLVGLAILVLTLVRIGWRIVHRPPPLPQTITPLSRVASKVGHGLMYLLMLVVPVIGIPTLLYRGRGIDFGLFAMPPLVQRTPEIFRPLTELHEIASYALVLLALGHIAAAFYHQAIAHDGLIQRMMPKGSRKTA
ncbi:MAG: hypothetical protein BGN85_11910 [Alphaproteobacteria bacterium 64-11]|nr:cytochrome b [Alphaproteobacteria bacterium]OJU11522.1 MAG: hypothetical protein BGN85_11910 [Alphaproteobacteria bacterium 64-11]